MKDCRLYYFFGEHRKLIDVPSYEFDSVIDDLSTEFEIITDDDVWNSTEHPGFICKLTDYFLIDYLGFLILFLFCKELITLECSLDCSSIYQKEFFRELRAGR